MSVRVCVLASSSAGNSIYIGTNKLNILVDAGLSCKQLTAKLAEIDVSAKAIDAIFVTHDHIDHTKGIGVFARRYRTPIYANAATWAAMPACLGEFDANVCRCFTNHRRFVLGDLKVEAFALPHDAADTVGFSFYHGWHKITVATDMGYVPPQVKDYLRDAHLLILEANHDLEMLRMGPYPWPLKKRIMGRHGHLSNEEAGRTIAELLNGMTKRVMLAHLSQENNAPELAYFTVGNIIEEAGFQVGKDVKIDLTYRDRISEMVILD